VIPAGQAAEFLAPLPIARIADGVFADDAFLETLGSLGLRTLGAFASLPESAVLQRFGRGAIIAHRRARGLGEPRADEVPAEAPVRELTVLFEFEPPLDGVDQLAFASSTHAERFTAALTAQGLVCTELRIELRDDRGGTQERAWSHPGNFTAYDVVNRIRWQAESLPQHGESNGAGIVSVRLSPQRTARASEHEPGLWNDAPDERVHHQLTRVQSLVGHEGVGTGVLLGGRLSGDRQRLVPWGVSRKAGAAQGSHPAEGGLATRPRDGPWPGSLPGATPNTVFDPPPRVRVLNERGEAVSIDGDELLSEDPALFDSGSGMMQRVIAWSAPWPLREGWWHAAGHGGARDDPIYRLQLNVADGSAWLLRYEAANGWLAEGEYA